MTPEEEFEAQERLKRLEEEEQDVSARRRKLHDRMAMFPEAAEPREEEEQQLSARRRELHREIDELRARLGVSSDGR